MNTVSLIGRLTKDPEIRYTSSQIAVCNATLAVDRPPRQGQNSNDKQADFIRITLFGKQAETFQKFLTKGRQVAVEGSIRTGSYQNQKGDTVYTTGVNVNKFFFIGNRDSDQTGSSAPRGSEEPIDIPEGFEAVDEDDIPF